MNEEDSERSTVPDGNLRDYYARRAEEYERIYDKPERQSDLFCLKETIPALLDGRHVLEIACGTGYWTQFVAGRAASVVATDVNEEVLTLARRKPYPRNNVSFARLDIYSEEGLSRRFDAGLAAFWWSHVPRQDLSHFVEAFHGRLGEDALVVYLDNRYVEGSLDDGSRYEVLKNIPDASELAAALGDRARSFEYVQLEYFWYASYRVAGP
jgi:SAM-dependent methyltransferase